MLQLLSALLGKNPLSIHTSLTSLITQYVSKRPTRTAINATITLHGITRSKELVDSFYKLGMGISYSNVLLLHDVWTMHDLSRCSICPDAIAGKVPSISIIDNDDFRNDQMGRSQTCCGLGADGRFTTFDGLIWCNYLHIRCLLRQHL